MALSKREKYVGIGVGIAVSLWVLDAFALTPYIDKRHALLDQERVSANKLSDATVLFARQTSDEKIWADMQKGGLKTDASAADSQAQHAMLDWFNGSGVYLSSLKSDPHVSQEGKFQVIKYHIQGDGHMRQMAQLLWQVETATIPVRVDELTLKPRGREGTDELTIELGVSTLSSMPEADRSGRTVSMADYGTERP